MSDLREGTVVGGRFEVVGVVGRGGTATVYLARDHLRGERLALKVLHPHLAHDPAMRERLRREVRAAALLKHEGALVAHDLHELDGLLALTLPFHPGQTLTERVAAEGRLPVAQVRALGTRLAGALADAHRKGLLHRDVTPNNVLVGASGDAVLTDFGLARLAEPGSSRSTGVIGTAGYAAPEIYRGIRRDPRSDLYGLGAVLYLAATGKAPFEAATPMGSLQRQLAEAHTPVAELRPDLPKDLAQLVELLLRADPERRPQGARDVLDALEQRVAPTAPVTATEPPSPKQHLSPGDWSVVVSERPTDYGRRHQLRQDRFRRAPAIERQVRTWAKQLVDGVRQTLGVWEDVLPEDALVAEVAATAGLPTQALALAPEVLERSFRLVDGVDQATAQRLCRRATEIGYDADVVPQPEVAAAKDARDATKVMVSGLWALIGVGALVGIDIGPLIAVGVALTLSAGLVNERGKRRDGAARYPVAYLADLTGHLQDGFRHLALAGDPGPAAREPTTAAPAEETSHGRRLARRALAQLDALEAAIPSADLPAPAVADLRATTKALRESTESLAGDVDRIEAALATRSGVDIAWAATRLSRLETMAKAGERVEAVEIANLRRAVEAHRADEAAADALESQLTAAQAQLLEIASSASRVHRELLAGPAVRHSADELVARLQAETRAADAARREAGSRQAARGAGQRQT